VIYDEELLELLGRCAGGPFEGEVFRHMFGDNPPGRENRAGARWNPPGVPAIYTSLSRETAIAEAEHILGLQPLRPRTRRTLYTLRVVVATTVRLARADLGAVDISDGAFRGLDFRACQEVGGAIAWLGSGGLVVPSARHGGDNLVVFNANAGPDDELRVLADEIIDPGRR
jgi:RES domain-containing protein